MPIRGNNTRVKGPTKNRLSIKKHNSSKKKFEPIKVLLFVIPIIIVAVLALGVWFAMKEYNKTMEIGNIKPSDLSIDSVQVVLTSEDYEKVLTVVSPSRKLPEDYNVDLEKYRGIYCDKLIIGPLEKMLNDAKEQGINLILTKGYISEDEQDKLYNDKVQELLASGNFTIVKAEAEAKKTVPPGNYSENQTGLSVGISVDKDMSSSDFISTDAYKWLKINCVNYGFVIRYPESKEEETDMVFDPMYYRFVGTDDAKKMRALDMCLDEYSDYINSR